MLGMPDDQPPQQEGGEAAGGERKMVRECWLGLGLRVLVLGPVLALVRSAEKAGAASMCAPAGQKGDPCSPTHPALQSRKARTRAAMAARREARLARQAGGLTAQLAAQRRRPLAPKREHARLACWSRLWLACGLAVAGRGGRRAVAVASALDSAALLPVHVQARAHHACIDLQPRPKPATTPLPHFPTLQPSHATLAASPWRWMEGPPSWTPLWCRSWCTASPPSPLSEPRPTGSWRQWAATSPPTCLPCHWSRRRLHPAAGLPRGRRRLLAGRRWVWRWGPMPSSQGSTVRCTACCTSTPSCSSRHAGWWWVMGGVGWGGGGLAAAESCWSLAAFILCR